MGNEQSAGESNKVQKPEKQPGIVVVSTKQQEQIQASKCVVYPVLG